MNNLLPTINEIVQYGLDPNIAISHKGIALEKSLLKIYSMSLDIEFEEDETEYPEYVRPKTLTISKNVTSNFKDFGCCYRVVSDVLDFDDLDLECSTADGDLSEIICDLLEVKWRIENNSLADGLWQLDFNFRNQTQHHILGLLTYLRERR